MSVSAEYFDVKVYRNNVQIFDDAKGEVVSFSIERSLTSERSEAQIRFDGSVVDPNIIKVNDAIEVWISTSGTIGLIKVFSGEIEQANKVREDGEPFIDVIAYDWSKLLGENKINLSYPIVENSSTIVKGIVSSIIVDPPVDPNERKISVTNVEGTTITRTIDFIGLTMFEALQKLSDYTLCDFYVDEEKDLNWFMRGTRSSTKTLGANDLQNYTYQTNKDVVNWAKVYGCANRSEPAYLLDDWSDSLDGWEPQEGGEAGTIEITGVPSTFTAEASPGWTRQGGHGIVEQDLNVGIFDEYTHQWITHGATPWLDPNVYTDIEAPVGYDGKSMLDWSLDNPNTFFLDLVGGNTFLESKLCLYTKFIPTKTTIWTAPCSSSSEFNNGMLGNYAFEANGGVNNGTYLRLWATSGQTLSDGCKTFDEETGNIRVGFWLKLPSEANSQNGDKIYLLYLIDTYPGSPDPYERTIGQIYIEKVNNVWLWRLRGEDQGNNWWTVTTVSTMFPNTWLHAYLDLDKGATSSATVTFRDESLNIIAQKTGINLAGCRIIRIRARAEWSPYRTTADNVGYDEILVTAAKRAENFEAKIWSVLLSNYVTYPFTVDDLTLEYSFVYCDTTSSFNTYDQAVGAALNLQMINSTGITGAGGSVKISWATLYIRADCVYGHGTPYLDTDDGDESYIETDIGDNEDYSWQDFDFELTNMAELVQLEIRVKGRNLGGTINPGDAGLNVSVWNTTAYNWSELADSGTWTTSDTTFSFRYFDATPYLTTRYNIENMKLKFKKTGASGTLRITYVEVYVKYLSATNLLSLDPLVKKAGDYSIRLFKAGSGGVGTIEASLSKTLLTPVGCQKTTYKEGMTILSFAVLIDMSVLSNLSQWERPQALIDQFLVRLYDSSDNMMAYSASDLYPERSFASTPSPQATKMKEIRIPVGEDAVAQGKWDLKIGSTFDWTNVSKIEFSVTGITDTSVEGNPWLEYLIINVDWLHFEEGKWIGEFKLDDNDPCVLEYGRNYGEVFDKTCYSTEDCAIRAEFLVNKYKVPVDTLQDVEIDYTGMESLKPGETITFTLPEGTISVRMTKITWTWDGNLFGKLDLDNEGFQGVS